MITKADIRTIIRLMIDDPQKVLWTDPNLDLLTEQIMDELWAKIHDYFPFFTSMVDASLSPLNPGYIDIRQTGTGTGQLTNRLHRIQSVVVGGASANALTYEKADPRDIVLQGGKVIYAPNYRYVLYGVQLYLFPLDITPSNVELRYSYKPTPAFRSLGDGSPVGWPDGHESTLWWRVASAGISRGSREDPNVFGEWHREAWDSMISSIKQYDLGPIVPYLPDSPTSFGST